MSRTACPPLKKWQQRVYHLPSAATFARNEHRDVATDLTGDRVDAASILIGALGGALTGAAGVIRLRRRREQD